MTRRQPAHAVSPLEATNPGHGTITNSYDSANRLTTTSYNDGTPTASYSYDPAGHTPQPDRRFCDRLPDL